jgi:hypothetical protein
LAYWPVPHGIKPNLFIIFLEYTINIFGIICNTKADGLGDRAAYGGFGLWPPYKRKRQLPTIVAQMTIAPKIFSTVDFSIA